MDGQEFDKIARLFAGSGNRRQALKRIAGGVLGGTFALGAAQRAGATTCTKSEDCLQYYPGNKCKVCVSGECKDKDCSPGKVTNEYCDPADGVCKCKSTHPKRCGDTCYPKGTCCTNGKPECPTGQSCQSGICKPPPCSSDSNCELGKICVNNTCQPGCRTDSNCSLGQICVNKTCQTGCRGDENCPTGQICSEKTCKPGCRGDGDCGADESCVKNVCTPDPTCGEGGATCSGDTDCCEGLSCVDGTCGTPDPGGVGTSCISNDECKKPLRCCGGPGGGNQAGVCSRVVCKSGYRPQGGFPNGPRCECCGNGVCSTRFIKRLVQR